MLIILSLSIIHSIFVIDTVGGPYRIREPFILLIGPLLLFYVRNIAGNSSFTPKDFLHFIPFLLFFLILSPVAVHGRNSLYAVFLYNSPVLMGLGVWTLIVLQFGYYWYRIIRKVNIHIYAVESEFSDTEGKTLTWIKAFVHIFGVFFLVLTLSIVIVLHGGNYFLVDRIVSISLSLTIFVLGYEGFFQQDVFTEIIKVTPHAMIDENQAEVSSEPEGHKEKISRTPNIGNSELVQSLLAYMEDRKPYLDEKITLTELARKLNMTRNQLSAVINNDLGISFYNLINKYRVEEVKRLLADPANRNFTILAIAYEAGFPAKSSFHSIFKKFTGLTPSEYRNGLDSGKA
ncbi:MAG: helix-turn-helix domain-containing protein [Syntrophothermus sp.]